MGAYRFLKSAFRRPPVQLEHLDITLSFFETHVDGEARLRLTAREPVVEIVLQAHDLDIREVFAAVDASGALAPAPFRVDADARTLAVSLPRPLAPGETCLIHTRSRCIPSNTVLDGIYRDVTPPGAPQQYMSQCQQWGFQRILPVIDDCTAKCTYRTTLEGDARYTHLISNGDVDRSVNPDGRPVLLPGDPSRQRITYINPAPMAPYLFIACAGTWDVLRDTLTLPASAGLAEKTVTLEYLVPPGRAADARIPLAILKDSVLWQRQARAYAYRYDTYRTICMEKSNFGGMENVGNTTIITEAALIDRYTSDARLIYAHGVIVHEYEHNECGSDVTMESPFDMWLNEAFTVDVERTYLRSVFNPAFLRLREVDAIRAPGVGPLATEDGGVFGRIVRDGFNHPDELVDGLTYVKAPEVVAMLRLFLGREVFDRGVRLYFGRHTGANANTDQFLACFEEASGRSLAAFRGPWLESAGYPRVTAEYHYDETVRRLTLTLTQTRTGVGAPFIVPVVCAAVGADGHDIPGTSRTLILDSPEQTFTFADVPSPAFVSLNRSASFYGTCEDRSATPGQRRLQVRHDADTFNRVEAMRALTDRERSVILDALLAGADPASLESAVSADWLDLVADVLQDLTLPDGLKGYLLQIDEQPLDRCNLRHVRECWQARRILLRAVARHAGDAVFRIFAATDTRHAPDLSDTRGLSAAIERRFLAGVLMEPLVASDTPQAHAALEAHAVAAVAISDRLNALSALHRSSHPRRRSLVAAAGDELRPILSGYIGWLGIIGRSPHADVCAEIAREASRPSFDISHPGLARALYIPFSLNNARLWTDEGLDFLARTTETLSAVNENTALRLIAPLQQAASLADDLRPRVIATLRRLIDAIPAAAAPSVHGRLADYLSCAEPPME
jgi:aminopeptidase N